MFKDWTTIINIIGFVTGALAILSGMKEILKEYRQSCENALAVKRDINHIKGNLSQIGLELNTFEKQTEQGFKEIEHRIDHLEIAIASIKGKLGID
jgi:hypothetical protein